MDPNDRLFGQIALHLKLLTREQVSTGLRALQGDSAGRNLGEVTIALGYLSQAQVDLAGQHQQRILAKRRKGGEPPDDAKKTKETKETDNANRPAPAVSEDLPAARAPIPRAATPPDRKARLTPSVARQAALEAVRQWRYLPGKQDGRPVAVRFTIYLDFHLE